MVLVIRRFQELVVRPLEFWVAVVRDQRQAAAEVYVGRLLVWPSPYPVLVAQLLVLASILQPASSPQGPLILVDQVASATGTRE